MSHSIGSSQWITTLSSSGLGKLPTRSTTPVKQTLQWITSPRKELSQKSNPKRMVIQMQPSTQIMLSPWRSSAGTTYIAVGGQVITVDKISRQKSMCLRIVYFVKIVKSVITAQSIQIKILLSCWSIIIKEQLAILYSVYNKVSTSWYDSHLL